ncbi:MAG: bifunctional diaminohydroxyphosphoribosylaminopyrimidine deaminase/5-amino-6-(5-phosphoribosylamino)uracil reductase RibD [Stomatobaculum sp.]|nr:bifunctional diaminohydroxyphosphoribosylaminopyrimidine deaminase/5-amino-6-(5-phosphoribosylamino)uracil reductase RibD [Stomatobaculum sp.]
MTHEDFMRRALALSLRGAGRVSPNPLVGAVIVKDGRIIGEGWHAVYGSLHAERAALEDCRSRGEDPAGADIYVTLEPCCHHGKQPPCTDALIEAGIARVLVGSGDPNPKVAGKGNRILRDHGIEVTEHLLEEECRKVNEVFFHYITTGLPLVVLKYAMTLDGKTACFTGESRWVTGEEARRHVHETRNRLSAIMTGVGTVLADDPLLTCRLEQVPETGLPGRNPVRIICDSTLRTPFNSKVVTTAKETPTIIATCCRSKEKQAPYIAAGCRILECRDASPYETLPARPQVDLRDLMIQLGAEGIDSVLLEGGSTLAWSALESGIVQKVQAYIAPKLFGGASSKTPVGGKGFPSPGEAVKLQNMTIKQLGDDLLLEGRLKTCSQD